MSPRYAKSRTFDWLKLYILEVSDIENAALNSLWIWSGATSGWTMAGGGPPSRGHLDVWPPPASRCSVKLSASARVPVTARHISPRRGSRSADIAHCSQTSLIECAVSLMRVRKRRFFACIRHTVQSPAFIGYYPQGSRFGQAAIVPIWGRFRKCVTALKPRNDWQRIGGFRALNT